MSTPAKSEKPKKERERQDWVIVLLILLLGLCCVAGAGQYALRFAPNWQLDTDMESNIDLNSQFLTGKPQGFFEPLDPAILTQPGWVNGNIFLTSGAFTTGTPLSTSTASTLVPTAIGTTAVATNTVAVTNTTIPTNTLVWVPVPATRTRRPPPADTETNTPLPPPPGANLGITITDGVIVNTAGDSKTYTITVSNPLGSSDVIGATVTDLFVAPMVAHDWTCAVTGTPGASCTGSGSGAINDLVNLPAGSSVIYTVTVTTDPSSSADLVNTATASLPVGYLGPTPVSATDIDETALLIPPGNINTGLFDNSYTEFPPGVIILAVTVTADGTSNPDMVYYEASSGGGVLMDWVRIEIGDGYNWYNVFDWGDNNPDTNTNVDFTLLPPLVPPEPDQRFILGLYNGHGVTIDIDSSVPAPGNYPYIRITTSPYGAGADGGTTDIDAIQPY